MGLLCSDNSVDITDFSFDVTGQGDDWRLHQRDATDSRGDLNWSGLGCLLSGPGCIDVH